VLLVAWVGVLGLLHDFLAEALARYWIQRARIVRFGLWFLAVARYCWRIAHPDPALPANIGAVYRIFAGRALDLYHCCHHADRRMITSYGMAAVESWPVDAEFRSGLQPRACSSPPKTCTAIWLRLVCRWRRCTYRPPYGITSCGADGILARMWPSAAADGEREDAVAPHEVMP